MKDYKEMAENVLKRRDQYLIQKRKKIRNITTMTSYICVCTLLGVIVWPSDIMNHKFPANFHTADTNATAIDTDAEHGADMDTRTSDNPGMDSIGTSSTDTSTSDSLGPDSIGTVGCGTENENTEIIQKEKAAGTFPENNSTAPNATEPPIISADIGSTLLAPVYTKLTEEALYSKMGSYLPATPPKGYTLENAYLTDSGVHVLWIKGMEELSWNVSLYSEADASRITSVNDTVNYDLTLYPIPRSESVPQELFQIVNNPIFRAEELTLDAVNARAYLIQDAGDCDGYRMNFSVLYDKWVISVSSKGVTPEWMYDNLSSLFQANDVSVVEMPLQDEASETGNLKPFEEVWGGCYMNAQGNWVVWLTEDTPENRAEVFKRNPSISQSSTEFKKADYSHSYLTQLMADISEAMCNDQLTGVSSAALYEDVNRVKVWITIEKDELTAKILSFDTIGGAIEIIYSPGNTTETMKEVIKEPEL